MESVTGQTVAIRKQYHFWPGENGLDAWDVDRLIELTRHLPVEQIAVASLPEIDSAYWFGGDARPTVRAIVKHVRLMREVDLSLPVIIGPDNRVMDGMHRVARALLDGLATLPAVRLTALPPPDYTNCQPDDLPY